MARPKHAATPEPGAKARQIIDGARSAFLEFGYEGASVDEIARRAKVSKPTLYNHFSDKRALFIAFVQHECDAQGASIFEVDLATPDVGLALRESGRRFLHAVLSPFGLGIFRIVVSESERFPELGRAFYAVGYDISTRRLALLLASAVGRGELAILDVEFAAQQFLQLCLGDCVTKRRFRVIDKVSDAEIERIVDAAVGMFLRSYRNDAPPSERRRSVEPHDA